YRADKYADVPRLVFLGQGLGVVSRVLDRLPRHLEKQPLLRIQHFRFPGRNVEEQRVELIHVVNETTAIPLEIPMPQTPFITLGGNLFYAIPARSQVVPQFAEVLRFGITAGHPYDGDILCLTRPLRAVCRWIKSGHRAHRAHRASALSVLCALCG